MKCKCESDMQHLMVVPMNQDRLWWCPECGRAAYVSEAAADPLMQRAQSWFEPRSSEPIKAQEQS